MPQFHREDWKSLANKLKSEKAPIYIVKSSSDPLKYYAAYIKLKDLRSLENLNSKKIVVIPYTADIHGVEYTTSLSTAGFINEETVSVRGITYQIWLKK